MIVAKSFCPMYGHKVKVIGIVFLRSHRTSLIIINKISRFCEIISIKTIPAKKQNLRMFVLRNQAIHNFFHTLANKEVFSSLALVFLSVNLFCIGLDNDGVFNVFWRNECFAYLAKIFLYKASRNIDYFLCIAIGLCDTQF